ncbi:MAG: DUF5666 domain-containing protein [Vicinamibacteria bacterium]|nr:DUF5666 domain-containing protein [Vicinamibacteria bacterium]
MPRLSPRSSLAALVVAAVFLLTACGGSPASPSPAAPVASGVTVVGRVVGATGSAASAEVGAASVPEGLVVSLRENPAVSVPVAADGSFTLRGLPGGSFTLVFLLAGSEVGSLPFTGLAPNQELSLTVALSTAGVVLLEERRNGIGHGDVELEGLVEAVLVVDLAADSRFTIAGHTVVARPGVTAIREGNRARTAAEVAVGRRVHVKGVWLTAEAGGQPVLAHEIKLQDEEEDGDGEGDPDCAISGGRVGERIELQGSVVSGSPTAFVLRVEGNRARSPVPVDAASASFECSPAGGPNAPTPAQCQASVVAGARVHVKGSLTACSATTAAVRASSVRVQK